MPLKRTPPKPSACDKSELKPEGGHQSTKITEYPPRVLSPIVVNAETLTARKRKRSNDCVTTMNEFRELLISYTAQTDNKLELLQTALTEIIAQNADIKNSVSFISKQYDELLLRAEKLEADRKSAYVYINKLEDRVEGLERMLNRTKIQFKNIPQAQDESKEDLCNLITETATLIGTPLQRQDIKEIYRLKRKEGIPTIIVDFATPATKEDIMKKVRRFNRKNVNNKLNTTHIKIVGSTKPIYITESLTSKAQQLNYLARKFAKDYGYKFCWTSFGKVFIRKNEGDKQILINNEEDVNQLRQKK